MAEKEFLRWLLEYGETYAEPAGFAKLPKAMVEEELNAIDKIR